MGSILIKNIGALVTGKLENPLREADSIFIKNGVVRSDRQWIEPTGGSDD